MQYHQLIESSKSVLDNCISLIDGFSKKEKSGYQKSLISVKSLTVKLREIQEDLNGDPLVGDHVAKFIGDFERALADILHVGKSFLGDEISREEYSRNSDRMKDEIEEIRRSFNRDIVDQVNSVKKNSDPLFDVEQDNESTVQLSKYVIKDLLEEEFDVYQITTEHVLELQTLLQEEKRKGIKLQSDKEKLQNAITENEKKKKNLQKSYEETTVGILDYKIELNVLLRVEKKANDRIAEYGTKIQELARHILALREKLESRGNIDADTLEETLNTLVDENRILRAKYETLQNDMNNTFEKARALSETVLRHDESDEELIEMKQEIDMILELLSDLRIELVSAEEKLSEYDEIISHLDAELKIALKEMRAARWEPSNQFQKEFKKFTTDAERIWDTLYTISCI